MNVPTKYHTGKGDSYVHFELHNDKEHSTNGTGVCYSELTYSPIDKKWTSVLLKQRVSNISYNEPEVKRWLGDLNEVGFPCHFEGMDGDLKIRLVLKEFKSKLHLTSTLMLIRLLWESGMNVIPDFYFQAMDKNPKARKLLEIQKAHKHPSFRSNKINPYGYYYNTNHTVTSPQAARNISKTELFRRLKKGASVWESNFSYTNGYKSVSATWS